MKYEVPENMSYIEELTDYKNKTSWFVFVKRGNHMRMQGFATQEEAEAALEKFRKELQK